MKKRIISNFVKREIGGKSLSSSLFYFFYIIFLVSAFVMYFVVTINLDDKTFETTIIIFIFLWLMKERQEAEDDRMTLAKRGKKDE